MAKKQIKGVPGFYWNMTGKTRIAENPLTGETLTKAKVERIQKAGAFKNRSKNWLKVRYKNLNAALDFASSLPNRAGILLTAHGNVALGNKSGESGDGWRYLSELNSPSVFRNSGEVNAIKAKISSIFSGSPAEYEVHWRW